jgi:hypothetical protein
MAEKGLRRKQCVGIFTDGAFSMVGKLRGFVTRVKAHVPECISSHCTIHRQALSVKKNLKALKMAFGGCEDCKFYKIIKNTEFKIFSALCGELGSSYTTLLLHKWVRWLSGGRVLVRVFTLRSEMLLFNADHSF